MTDLIEFLRQRLNEDERWALEAEAARHDPARVLREVKAKRRILSEHRRHEHYPQCCKCSDLFTADHAEHAQMDRWPCATIRALASIYSDHPDCQQEWA